MKQFKFDRQYLGVTVTAQNYREILSGPGKRQDLRFHEKHLRAYLKGKDSFTHGWEVDQKGNKIRPQVHQVQQLIIVLKDGKEFVKFRNQSLLNKFLKDVDNKRNM